MLATLKGRPDKSTRFFLIDCSSAGKAIAIRKEDAMVKASLIDSDTIGLTLVPHQPIQVSRIVAEKRVY